MIVPAEKATIKLNDILYDGCLRSWKIVKINYDNSAATIECQSPKQFDGDFNKGDIMELTFEQLGLFRSYILNY